MALFFIATIAVLSAQRKFIKERDDYYNSILSNYPTQSLNKCMEDVKDTVKQLKTLIKNKNL